MFAKGSLLLLVPLLAGCVKDRVFPVPVTPPGAVQIAPGVLKVNEFVCTGSQNANEFGTNEDWFEIYNTTEQDLLLEEGRWYVSDAGPSGPTKFQLPEITIPARGFLVIWCDNLNTVATQIHTNFALSASGEHLVIYYSGPAAEFVVDDYQYGPQSSPGASLGRAPDGADNWVLFSSPTPGSSNQ
ncbi:MAG: hypothetical protein KF905_08770 [Flavobacteriales bacterium]|nr:hypothetical protein [Flavobacteriales bacterium]